MLVAVSAGCLAVDTVLAASTYGSLFSEQAVAEHGWPLVPGAALVASLMGALIVSRHPRHLVGWLLAFIGVTTSLSLLTSTYGIWVRNQYGTGPVPRGPATWLTGSPPSWGLRWSSPA